VEKEHLSFKLSRKKRKKKNRIPSIADLYLLFEEEKKVPRSPISGEDLKRKKKRGKKHSGRDTTCALYVLRGGRGGTFKDKERKEKGKEGGRSAITDYRVCLSASPKKRGKSQSAAKERKRKKKKERKKKNLSRRFVSNSCGRSASSNHKEEGGKGKRCEGKGKKKRKKRTRSSRANASSIARRGERKIKGGWIVCKERGGRG